MAPVCGSDLAKSIVLNTNAAVAPVEEEIIPLDCLTDQAGEDHPTKLTGPAGSGCGLRLAHRISASRVECLVFAQTLEPRGQAEEEDR